MMLRYTFPGLAVLLCLAALPATAQPDCGCWIEPDSTWTNINPRPTTYTQTPLHANGRYGPIALPFNFRFFGREIDTLYVDKNGMLRLDESTTGSPGNFPDPLSVLAPFWAVTDIYRYPLAMTFQSKDTINNVFIRATPTAFYVTWSDVARYRNDHGKLNTFQVVITDGTDPVIPDGNNVSYCYKQLEWASGPSYPGSLNGSGFDGIPATVGASKGDGVYYMQLGRFGLPDSVWYGYSQVSGIRWLNGRRVAFNTDIDNITPFFSTTECDTIEVPVGAEGHYEMIAHRGGPAPPLHAEAHAPSLSDFGFTDETVNEAHKITASFTPTEDEVGLHIMQFQAYTGIGPMAVVQRYVKVVPTLNVEESDRTTVLSVSPNPASGHAVVRWTGAPLTELQLIDGSGRLVRTMRPERDWAILSTQGLQAGVYVLRSLAPGRVGTVRLMVTGP